MTNSNERKWNITRCITNNQKILNRQEGTSLENKRKSPIIFRVSSLMMRRDKTLMVQMRNQRSINTLTITRKMMIPRRLRKPERNSKNKESRMKNKGKKRKRNRLLLMKKLERKRRKSAKCKRQCKLK